MKRFTYEQPGRPLLLTSTIDENGAVMGAYGYDADGRAISSRVGSTGSPLTVAWATPPSWSYSESYDAADGLVHRVVGLPAPLTATITDADGRQRQLTSSSVDRNTDGDVVRRVDFNGGQSCHAYVAGRHLESSRVDGLAAGADCASVLASGATVTAPARKVSKEWHPDWRLPVRTAEPRRIVTSVYNGQPDPFAANAIASCAPAGALLPDGKPIVVLCKQVEQATTDETGASGFGAVPQSGVPARTASWTYDVTGQVLTETDARGTVVDTRTYYPDATTDHAKGDLQSSTNAAGHATTFTRYNGHGLPLEMVNANGIGTTYAYDARQRLKSVTTVGETTAYDYWPTGLLKRTTQADGSAVSYEYDSARRLTAIADTLGNRIEYTLDNSGNRTREDVKDPTGTLKRTMSRVFDALGRAQQTTGRE
ncbi:hypothetical protein [Roseateles aquatilis]|uniref:hypothetical protein n=1 Tax=Roseateles aquatilis TaxID=431061 RepID=UPI0013034B7D|nr:hypothetical protein [Roseateles aquatilis]